MGNHVCFQYAFGVKNGVTGARCIDQNCGKFYCCTFTEFLNIGYGFHPTERKCIAN